MITTGFVLLGAFVFVLLYDLFRVLKDHSYEHTVSQWVYQTSKTFMIIPVFAGIAVGHFWWPIHDGPSNIEDVAKFAEQLPEIKQCKEKCRDSRIHFEDGKCECLPAKISH